MNTDQQLIEALQGTIKAQVDLINYLKLEVERLKSTQLVFNPNLTPGPTTAPLNPLNPQPFVPGTPGSPYQPFIYSPLQPPYIVTSGPTGSGSVTVNPDGAIVATGDPLPLGSIQFGSTTTNKVLGDLIFHNAKNTETNGLLQAL